MTESRQGSATTERDADRAWLAYWNRSVGVWRIVAPAAGVASGWLVIAQAGLLAALVHAVAVAGAGLSASMPLLLALLGIILLRAGCNGLQEWAAAEAAYRVQHQLRVHLYQRLIALGPVGAARYAPGSLASAVMEQINALGPYAGRYQPQMVITVIVPVGILAVVLWLDWLAALLLLFAAPLIPLFMALVGMGAEAVSRSQHQAMARLGGYFADRLRGLDLLRHLGRADDEARTLERVGDAYRRRSMAVLRVAFLSSAVLEFFSSVAIAMIAIYIGMGLLGYVTYGPAPELTLFTGLFILLLAPEFFQPLRQLAQYYHDRAAALGAAAELRPIAEARSPMPMGGDSLPPGTAPRITLEGATVQGDADATLLETVDLDIHAAESVLIQGPSGSGKTTLLHVIAGFTELDAGAVRVNEVPLSQMDRSAWQQCIGWLGQRPGLVPGTLRATLAPQNEDAPDTVLNSALRRAGAADVVEAAPQGLETSIDERGGGFSGGEAQRLALARALLRDAPILLMDEPTASLDPQSAAQVSEALRAEAARGVTVIIASHAVSRFAWVDRTITLSEGRVTGDRHA